MRFGFQGFGTISSTVARLPESAGGIRILLAWSVYQARRAD
jgi:hypothetical protein